MGVYPVYRIGRRSLLATAALAAPAILSRRAAAAASRIIFSLWGGSSTTVLQKAYFDSFTKETGIEIVPAAAPSLAKVRAQVQSGETGWDMVVALPGWDTVGGSKLWAPIDYDAIPMPGANPALKRPYTVAYAAFGGGICYSTARNATIHPETWAQYWDTAKFPGRRGLRTRGQETLEIALMADGVPVDKLYPLDLDRAFESLDRIKPAITNWIEATEQTVSLVQNNDCDFTYAYSSRVGAAQLAGTQLGFSLKQNILQPILVSVVANSPNKAACMKLLAYMMRPEGQAAYARIAKAAPIIPAGVALLDPAIQAGLPQLNDSGNVWIDEDYWGKNVDPVERRFKEWLLT